MNFEDIDGNHYPFDQISESSDNKIEDDERDEIKKYLNQFLEILNKEKLRVTPRIPI
jgi:hypothetical protein